jgi:hypothetical protein
MGVECLVAHVCGFILCVDLDIGDQKNEYDKVIIHRRNCLTLVSMPTLALYRKFFAIVMYNWQSQKSLIVLIHGSFTAKKCCQLSHRCNDTDIL